MLFSYYWFCGKKTLLMSLKLRTRLFLLLLDWNLFLLSALCNSGGYLYWFELSLESLCAGLNAFFAQLHTTDNGSEKKDIDAICWQNTSLNCSSLFQALDAILYSPVFWWGHGDHQQKLEQKVIGCLWEGIQKKEHKAAL